MITKRKVPDPPFYIAVRRQQTSQEVCKYIRQMYFKDFDKWNIVKKRVHTDEIKVSIRAGEIRWLSFGVNVGSEIDGKGESFYII